MSPRRKCTELFLWGVLQLDHNQRSLSLAELAEDPGAGFVLQEGLMVPGRDVDSSDRGTLTKKWSTHRYPSRLGSDRSCRTARCFCSAFKRLWGSI